MNTSKNIVSSSTLLISLLTAMILSAAIYFSFILPAEFGKDPTGIGKKLGLLKLSTTSAAKAESKENINIDTVAFEHREDFEKIIVPKNKGIEYKFNLVQYGRLKYEWSANGENLYYDFHGEPKGDKTGFFESYTIATSNKASGTMTVPFEGVHGWYWKNTSDKDITVQLKTSGNYTVAGLKK